MWASTDTREGLHLPAPRQMRRGVRGVSSGLNLTELGGVQVRHATPRPAISRFPKVGLEVAVGCFDVPTLLKSAFRAPFTPVGLRRKLLFPADSARRPSGWTDAAAFGGRPGPCPIEAQTTVSSGMSSGELPLPGERSEMR